MIKTILTTIGIILNRLGVLRKQTLLIIFSDTELVIEIERRKKNKRILTEYLGISYTQNELDENKNNYKLWQDLKNT